MVMMETQIQPIDMTPGPPFVRPKENEVVMPVPARRVIWVSFGSESVTASSTAHRWR